MLKKITIAAGLLLGSFLAAWAASSTLSGLSAGGPISRTDLFYDVQTTGVGGVKVTGTQFLSFVFGNAVMNTATITGNLTGTTAQFTGALSGTTSVFQTATINSITSTQCVHAINGLLSGSGADCGTGSGSGSTSIVAGTNITTSGVVTNTTVNVVATPTFTSITTTLASVTGWLTAAGVNMQTTTIASLGGSTQCVQSVAGVITGTGSNCGGTSTVKGGPLLPSSEYLGGANGLLAPTFYIPAVNTSGAGAFEGIAMIPTSTIATASLQFNMPENIPTGNARLRILQMSTGTTGSVQYTVADAVTSSSNSLGTVTLNFEGVFSVAQTVADQLIEKKILLTVTPTANQIMSVVIGTTSGTVPIIVYQPSIVWE